MYMDSGFCQAKSFVTRCCWDLEARVGKVKALLRWLGKPGLACASSLA